MATEDVSASSESGSGSTQGVKISPQLVDEVAERVWRMWKQDLRIERERYRPSRHRFIRQGGN